jgi:hypothetical protein
LQPAFCLDGITLERHTGVLEHQVEAALTAAAERNRRVADDRPRQCWATICSGLNNGLLQLIDLDTGGSTAIPEGPRQGENVIDLDAQSAALPRLKAASCAATCCAADWR